MYEDTDRGLLELAARAIGWKNCAWEGEQFRVMPGNFIGHNLDYFYWSPLTDDGDALRLAVKLRIKLTGYEAHGTTRALACANVGGHQTVEFYTDDGFSAARRAIVRAAAEIGKAML